MKKGLRFLVLIVGGSIGLYAVQFPANHSSSPTIVHGQSAHEQAAGPTSKSTSSTVSWKLRIPKIHVDARIEAVGLTPERNMQAPGAITAAGWYKLGPSPGQTGSAVITGHLYGLKGEPGVFVDLKKLRSGDVILVQRHQHTTTFAVRASHIYQAEERPPRVFDSDDGKAHLNLITCEGKWDSIKQTYTNRLVVYADGI